jgi:hypothetical protein
MGLRGLRVVRKHHLSALSGAILIGALAVALTSPGFEIADSTTAEQASAAPEPALPLPALGNAPAPVYEERWLVYFIVESVEQIRLLNATMRSDAFFIAEQGLPPMRTTFVDYLLFNTPEEEAWGARFLNQMAEVAFFEGYNLQIVDLTQ